MIESYVLIGFNLIWILAAVFALSVVFVKLKGNWVHKALFTTLLFASVFSSVKLWNEIQGSPKGTSEIEGFIVRAYVIKEPSRDKDGKIWLWGFYPEEVEPKSLSIPYSKKMHEKLMNNQGMAKGRPQQFQKGKKSSDLEDHELAEITPYSLPKD
jgi:hypothetical protein